MFHPSWYSEYVTLSMGATNDITLQLNGRRTGATLVRTHDCNTDCQMPISREQLDHIYDPSSSQRIRPTAPSIPTRIQLIPLEEWLNILSPLFSWFHDPAHEIPMPILVLMVNSHTSLRNMTHPNDFGLRYGPQSRKVRISPISLPL